MSTEAMPDLPPPIDAPTEGQIWSPWVVGGLAAFFGPMTGAILVTLGLRRIGEIRKANLVFIGSIVGVAAIGAMLAFVSAEDEILSRLVAAIGPAVYPALQWNEWQRYRANDPEREPARFLGALGWSIPGLLASAVLLLVPMLLVSNQMGVEDIELNASADVPMVVGEPTALYFEVTNTATEAQLLKSIDLSREFIDQIGATVSDPVPSHEENVPLADLRSFYLNLEIPPGESRVVTISALPAAPGLVETVIDACIQIETNCAGIAIGFDIVGKSGEVGTSGETNSPD